MSKKQIQSDEKVGLKLTQAERKVILNEVMCLNEEYEGIVRTTPTSKPVMMTLDELDNFGGYVAAEANYCDDKKKQKKLDGIFEKIQRLLDEYTDKDDDPELLSEARRKIGKAMADALAGKEPKLISFRLPTPKKQQTEMYPIKITPLQREALISCTQLKAVIKRRLKEADEGSQVIEFSKKELDHMGDELGQAAVFAPSPYKKRIVAVQKKVADILDELQLEAFGIKQPKKRRRPANKSDLLFQFKITLLDIQPPIWRRIQIRDCTLGDLHEHIQTAMGWLNCHLHQFRIDGERYGPQLSDDFDLGMELIDEDSVPLSGLLPKSGKKTRWAYEYDFGDGWRHEVAFEGYPPVEKGMKFPMCLEGERACPPEDIGGTWGFADYLEALADPKHEQHEELLEWRGPFNPEELNAKKVTREMRRGLPDWRQYE